jgi:hypothetical protein
MIQLHPDYLVFHTSQGENIPASAETVTIELIGEAVSSIDPEVVREAAAAVVHYFKDELKQEQVSIGEFSQALERVLNSFGYNVSSSPGTAGSILPPNVAVADLEQIALESKHSAFELVFFQKLRTQFHQLISSAPHLLKFEGLRRCVKQLLGVKHWCRRCERLSDQIVEFLRACLVAECGSVCPGLVVR